MNEEHTQSKQINCGVMAVVILISNYYCRSLIKIRVVTIILLKNFILSKLIVIMPKLSNHTKSTSVI